MTLLYFYIIYVQTNDYSLCEKKTKLFIKNLMKWANVNLAVN